MVIRLFSKKAIEIEKSNTNFYLKQYNVLKPVPFNDKFDLIRGMNLFIPSYFKPEDLKVAFRNLNCALKNNGNRYEKILESGNGVNISNIENYLKLNG